MLQLATFWGRRRRMLIRERDGERRHDGKRYCALSSPLLSTLHPSLVHSFAAHGENVRTRGHEEAGPPLNCTFAGRKFKYPAAAALPQPPPHLSHVAEKEWVPKRTLAEVVEAGVAEWFLNAVTPLQPSDKRSHAACARVLSPRACMCGRPFAVSRCQ